MLQEFNIEIRHVVERIILLLMVICCLCVGTNCTTNSQWLYNSKKNKWSWSLVQYVHLAGTGVTGTSNLVLLFIFHKPCINLIKLHEHVYTHMHAHIPSSSSQPSSIHCRTKASSASFQLSWQCVICCHWTPLNFVMSSIQHFFGWLLGLLWSLGIQSRISTVQQLSLLHAICPAHCHFYLLSIS